MNACLDCQRLTEQRADLLDLIQLAHDVLARVAHIGAEAHGQGHSRDHGVIAPSIARITGMRRCAACGAETIFKLPEYREGEAWHPEHSVCPECGTIALRDLPATPQDVEVFVAQSERDYTVPYVLSEGGRATGGRRAGSPDGALPTRTGW